jgi:DNA sulfur modification protein DndD
MTVPKSTGENQILSLSFIGALAGYADEQSSASSLLGPHGAAFPIVMDAAFGNLDTSYRRDIARALPDLAPQVVVLVSRAQGEGEVEAEMRSYIGRRYVIAYHTPKPDAIEETIEIDGHAHPYVVQGSSERAELLEVNVS